MTSCADDKSVIGCGNDLAMLITDMVKSFEAITIWLKKLGLKVNESKQSYAYSIITLNHKSQLEVNGVQVTSKPSFNVLE